MCTYCVINEHSLYVLEKLSERCSLTLMDPDTFTDESPRSQTSSNVSDDDGAVNSLCPSKVAPLSVACSSLGDTDSGSSCWRWVTGSASTSACGALCHVQVHLLPFLTCCRHQEGQSFFWLPWRVLSVKRRGKHRCKS